MTFMSPAIAAPARPARCAPPVAAVPASGPALLAPLVPYLPPLTRDVARCVCGGWGARAEESLCRTCREQAVAVHGERLAALLSRITYGHRGVRLHWTGPDTDAECFTPRVHFTAPDVNDPGGPAIELRWFEHWADDQLVTACAHGARDEEILALAVAQAHYALATLLVHEVGEWFTYHGRQVFPPHRRDPHLPLDEDNGPDGNGPVVLWLTYSTTPTARAEDTGPTAGHGPLTDPALVLGQEAAPPLSSAGGPGAGPACPVNWAALGARPGRVLTLAPHGITVTAPDTTTFSAWSPRARQQSRQETLEQALRDIHHVMVRSGLCDLAAHLNLDGVPVLAPHPGTQAPGAPWQLSLAYDG
ncbi:hypothetical protein ACMATS_38320 (plasmid) [Streptoverticillium reticulum]|uniref:hypothetical protein n=1 Tax=Streptoverticillium reticulum TaxID=1433415 RepID=UPI0039BEF923